MSFNLKTSIALEGKSKEESNPKIKLREKNKKRILKGTSKKAPVIKGKVKSIHSDKLRKEGEETKRSPKDSLNYKRYVISIETTNEQFTTITIYDRFLGRENGRHTFRTCNEKLKEKVAGWVKHIGAKTCSTVLIELN